MSRRKIAPCVFLLGLGAFVASLLFLPLLFLMAPSQGEAFETWESEGKNFKIRVTACKEDFIGLGVSGAYYRYECASSETGGWKEILTFRHDDPIAIPRDQVRYLSDDVAYVFIGWVYAVTSDGGNTWSVWRADKDLPGLQGCNYGLIRDVVLDEQGNGSMMLRLISGRPGEAPTLRTSDFGRVWLASAS